MFKKTLIVVVSVFAFFGMKFLIGSWGNDRLHSMAQTAQAELAAEAEVAEGISELKQIAAEREPGVYESEAIGIAANSKASKILSDSTTLKQKRINASSVFMGFYLINSRGRQSFCNEYGVDISAFSKAFIAEHNKEYDLAKKYYFTSPELVEQVYRIVKNQFKDLLEIDMTDIASAIGNGSLTDACNIFKEFPDDLSKDLRLEKIQPEVFNILHSNE